jgi:uncharacterized protein YqgC (DUF456 family)
VKNLLILIPDIGLFVFVLVGILLVPLGLPGTWVIAAAAFIYSIFFDFKPPGDDWVIVLILITLAVLGELLELWVGVMGGKKMNVSTGAIIASILGGLIGAFVGVPVFLIGSLLGLLLGVFLGAFLYEWITTRKLRVAFGSALAVFFSRIVATFVKTSIALGMGIYLGFKVF